MRKRINPLPSQAYLFERFTYDPAGHLVWKPTDDDSRCGRTWNTRFAGQPAGCIGNKGYVLINLQGQVYLAERLIWLFCKGEDPGPLTVDHKDRVRHHNWIDNLRLATYSQNARNKDGFSKKGLPKGIKKQGRRFRAQLMLGQYATPEEAGAAVEACSDKLEASSDRMADLMYTRRHERRGTGSKTGLPRGVEELRERGLWRAYITIGSTNSEEEAVSFFNEAALIMFGEYARLS